MTYEERKQVWNDVFTRMIVELRNSDVPYCNEDFAPDPNGCWHKCSGEWTDVSHEVPSKEMHSLITTHQHRVAREAAVWSDAAVSRVLLNQWKHLHLRTVKPKDHNP